MSRHDDDGGNNTTSGDDGGNAFADEASAADELSDWLDEAADADAHSARESDKSGGWIGRMLGRERDEDPKEALEEPETAEGYDSRLGSDPDSLSVFSAVQIDDDDDQEPDDDDSDGDEYESDDGYDAESTAGEYESPDDDEDVEADEHGSDDDDEATEATEALDIDEYDLDDNDDLDVSDDDDPEATEGLDESIDVDDPDAADLRAQSSSAPEDAVADEVDVDDADADDDAAADEEEESFDDLWGGDPDEDELDDIIDFASFTSEDYVQATTREYAGLAEAVARAEEEDTQRIAVSAEIPGLESGLVGLEDVVGAAGGDTADIVEPPRSSDLPMRVLTALGLITLFAASLLSPYGIGALIVVVLGIAAGEMYSALIRAGYRPLSIFGFAGIAGAFFGTWAAGPIAIPISLLLSAIAVFLFYATVPGRRATLENATLTLLVLAWIGGLGGLAFDLLRSDDYQWLVLALVITVAAMDIAQYFVGRRIGKRQLAPQASPKKTVEGYIAGVVVALGIGAAFGLATPFDVTDGLIIGAVVAIIAPLGDLAVSVLKRALGVKDMGYILPGHGGVLDRVDAMIMTIPALWLAYSWMGLVI